MPPLTNAKQIIENADSYGGVHVNEDLSISYTPPKGTSKEAAEANAKTVAAAEAELKAEAAKWWAAENDVAAQTGRPNAQSATPSTSQPPCSTLTERCRAPNSQPDRRQALTKLCSRPSRHRPKLTEHPPGWATS